MRTFTDKMMELIERKRSILNVGLDPQLRFMPPHLIDEVYAKTSGSGISKIARLFYLFNKAIIDAIEPFAVSVKPNIAFYESYGYQGIRAYERTVKYARKKGLLVIGDTKRGDGGDTAVAYANAHIGQVPVIGIIGGTSCRPAPLSVDAVTINASIGTSCVDPFISCIKKYGAGVFVLTKTSFNPNSEPEQIKTTDGRSAWISLAKLVSNWGKGTEGELGYRSFGVVLGATYPEDAPTMRVILPNSWFLIPGYGAQGGGADGAVVGINRDGFGGIVNSSRGIIAAWNKGPFKSRSEDFANAAAKAAEFAKTDLNNALKRADKGLWT